MMARQKRRSFGYRRNALSLLELTLTMALLGLIVMGAYSFDLASRKFLRSSERSIRVLNELTFLVEHMQKNVLLGIGDAVSAGNEAIRVTTEPNGLLKVAIRQDAVDPATGTYTPWDYTDDHVALYVFNPSNDDLSDGGIAYPSHSITFDGETIVRNLTEVSLSADAFGGGLALDVVVLRYDPHKAVHPRDNPQAIIVNQSFHSLSQSLS